MRPPSWPPPGRCHHCTPGTWLATSRVWVLSKRHGDRQNRSTTVLVHPCTTHPHPQGTARLRAQPRGLTHMAIPPTLLLLCREKTENNLACAGSGTLKSKSPGLELGSPGSQAQPRFCIAVHAGQSLPTSRSFLLIER